MRGSSSFILHEKETKKLFPLSSVILLWLPPQLRNFLFLKQDSLRQMELEFHDYMGWGGECRKRQWLGIALKLKENFQQANGFFVARKYSVYFNRNVCILVYLLSAFLTKILCSIFSF